ncbi:MAG TPA: dockerin type I domain-containing protein, partial [Dehalococcoidia bacterium]
ATVDVCSAPVVTLGLMAGNTVDVICGSATVMVLSGPVDATFGGVDVMLPTGATATVTETSPNVFEVSNDGAVPIVVDGGTVAPGEVVQVTGGPNCFDLNGDGTVTGRDVSIVARAMPSHPGHKRWNADADLNGDNVVNLADLKLVLLSLHDRDCK